MESKLLMMFNRMAKAKQNRVWWLESGRERCSICGHNYVDETAYYCEGCDSAICSISVEETFFVTVF